MQGLTDGDQTYLDSTFSPIRGKNYYRHSSIYAVNVGTQKKTQKQKPCKSRLLSVTKGDENMIEL